MKRKIYKRKIIKFYGIIKTLNNLRNTIWYISLMRDQNDTEEERVDVMKKIRIADRNYKQYRSRVIQYISVFNQNANWLQRININRHVEYEG